MQEARLKPNALQQTKRNSAMELLRIVAMLFVVVSHACVHSGMDSGSMPVSLNKFIAQWGVLGNLGVDIYVMITGYFLCTKESGQIRSLTKLFAQVWFYSIALFLVAKFGFGQTFSLMTLLKVFLPTIFEQYWFFTAYVALVVLSPGLNILLKAATRKQLLSLLAGLIFIWIIIPTFKPGAMYGDEIAQFILLYLIGAYFRMYPDNCFQSKKLRIVVTTVSFAVMFLSTVALDVLGTKISALANRGVWFYNRNSLLTIGCAVGLLAGAVYKKPFYNRFVNTVGGCTFGVYLIHESISFRPVLWGQILPVAKFRSSPLLVVVLLGAVLAVFSGAALIEYLRQNTVAKPMTKALDLCVDKVTCLGKALWQRVKKTER